MFADYEPRNGVYEGIFADHEVRFAVYELMIVDNEDIFDGDDLTFDVPDIIISDLTSSAVWTATS